MAIKYDSMLTLGMAAFFMEASNIRQQGAGEGEYQRLNERSEEQDRRRFFDIFNISVPLDGVMASSSGYASRLLQFLIFDF